MASLPFPFRNSYLAVCPVVAAGERQQQWVCRCKGVMRSLGGGFKEFGTSASYGWCSLNRPKKSSELSRGPRHRLFQSPLRHTWQLEMMIEEVSKKMRLTEVNCSDLWVTSCCIHWLKAITLHYKVAGNGLRWEMVISSAVTQGRDWYLGPWVMGSDERMKWCDKFLNAV